MKKYFLAGLVTLLPLAVTFWIIAIIVRFLTKPFENLLSSFLEAIPGFSLIPKRTAHVMDEILILILLFLLTLFLGFIARRFFFNRLIKFGDSILYKIPLVNTVYKTSKDIVRSLFSTQKQSFKQVVLLHFPYRGAYCLGLIASDAPQTCSSSTQSDDLVSVFIPTTPNPTTGYLVLCNKSDLTYLKMKTEDAIKYVVSCAVIQPEKMT